MESISRLLSVEEVQPDLYISSALPKPTGNAVPIAYGGCAIGVCVHAAYKTITPGLSVYAVSGVFLGPTRIDRKVYIRITRVRSTKTFASRQVLAYQLQDDGTERACLNGFVDFHREEPALLTYSIPQPAIFSNGPEDKKHFLTTDEVLSNATSQGIISEKQIKAFKVTFGLMLDHFDQHYPKEGVAAQNAFGQAKLTPTTQDHLHITEKLAAEWVRVKEPLPTAIDNIVTLCFFLDAGLSFLPLANNQMDFGDTSSFSTLDFAIRIMKPNIDLHQWIARERKTISAAVGRTYNEGRLWADGQLIASMTQTCILRPLKSKTAKI